MCVCVCVNAPYERRGVICDGGRVASFPGSPMNIRYLLCAQVEPGNKARVGVALTSANQMHSK